MPAQQSHAAQLLLGNYAVQCYMSVYAPDPLASGTLTLAPVNGSTALAVSYSVGSESDVRSLFLLRFYDTGTGAFKGETRVRKSGAITSSSLPIRELSYGSAKLASGDTFRVYAQVPMDTVLVDATASFRPDGENYSDENSNPPPIGTSGGPWAGWVDSSTSYALVTLNGSGSRAVDPDNVSGVTYFMPTLPSGVAFHSGSTNSDASPVLEVSAGQYCIERVFSDADTTRASSQFVPIMAHDPAVNPPYHVLLPTPPVGDQLTGWSWTVELVENATLTDIPDGSLCVLWADEYLGAGAAQTKQSYRSANTGRSHILGIGYARRDTSTGSAVEGDRVTFEIQSPLARLAEIASYSKVLEQSASPDAWSKVKTLGIVRAITQLIQFYTTLQEAGFDFVVNALFSDARYPAFYIQRSDVLAQIRELAGGRRAVFANNERGAQFELFPHLAFLSMTERASVTTTFTLTDSTVFTYSLPREHQDSIEIFELQGITGGASGNTAVFSRSPGLSPGGGKNYVTQGKYIPNSQTTQNADAAMMKAFIDQIFIDSDNANRKYRVGEMTLTMPGQYAFWDFNCEYTYFDYAGSARGIDFGDFRYWLKRFQSTVDDNGAWTSQAVFQMETGAPADGAETYNPPDESTIAPPISTQPPPNWPTSTPTDFSVLGTGTATLGFVAGDGYFYYADIRVSSPVWFRVALSGLHASPGTPVTAIIDAYNPLNSIAITDTKAYQFLNMGSSTRSFAHEYSFRDTDVLRSMQSERGASGLFVVHSYQVASAGSHGSDIEVTTDAGVNWTRHTSVFGTWIGGPGDGVYPGMYVFAHTAGKVLTSGYTGVGVTTGRLKVSVDSAATWSNFDGNTFDQLASDIHCPYMDESITYHGGCADTGQTNYKLYKTVGGVRTNISPSYGGEEYGPTRQFSVKTCDVDKRSVLCCGTNNDNTVKHGVFLSRNEGVTWTTLITPDASVKYLSGCFDGDNPQGIWLWGNDGSIQHSSNGGTSWKDLSGNLSSFSAPAVGLIENIMGLG